jgi:hypothetical protein
MARKTLSLVLVLVFSWLQTYQLCDASEDIIQDLPDMAQITSGHKTTLSEAPAPDEDADAQIPQVFEQTLTQGGESTLSPLIAVEWQLPFQSRVLASFVDVPDSRSLSPPNDLSTGLVGHSNDVFIPSKRTLAPPLA